MFSLFSPLGHFLRLDFTLFSSIHTIFLFVICLFLSSPHLIPSSIISLLTHLGRPSVSQPSSRLHQLICPTKDRQTDERKQIEDRNQFGPSRQVRTVLLPTHCGTGGVFGVRVLSLTLFMLSSCKGEGKRVRLCDLFSPVDLLSCHSSSLFVSCCLSLSCLSLFSSSSLSSPVTSVPSSH